MKVLLNYLKEYIYSVDKWMLLACSLLAAAGIFLNYHFDLNRKIISSGGVLPFFWWYLIFSIAFVLPYVIFSLLHNNALFTKRIFLLLVLFAPAIFAWKMWFKPEFHFSNIEELNAFYNQLFYWPFKLFMVSLSLLVLWKIEGSPDPFYGISTKAFKWSPYLGLLCLMIPLIGAASTQPDFLAVYPKLKYLHYGHHAVGHRAISALAYELSYGSDFLTIELFFRGFLVLAFVRFAGKASILPMAVFYCTIHFGKPLAECISSFFGGIILGVITYHTRSIWGGLIVHLGIAWLMELGGYLGNVYY